MIVRLAIRLVVLAAIIGVVTRIVPGISHRDKHAHPARAVHDSA
jgi:hypothetical protein